LGDPKSVTYSGSAKDVAFQQLRIQRRRHELPRHARPDAADQQLRARHRPGGAASRHTGATNNPAGGGATAPMPGTFFQQVTPQQADVSQPWDTRWSST
jgi:hypothetical protein